MLHGYVSGPVSRLAAALAAAMDERGMSPADLARAAGIPEPTMYHLASGRAGEPQLHTRQALDAYLAPESPGATWRIIRGLAERYPSEPARRLCGIVLELSPPDLDQLLALAVRLRGGDT